MARNIRFDFSAIGKGTPAVALEDPAATSNAGTLPTGYTPSTAQNVNISMELGDHGLSQRVGPDPATLSPNINWVVGGGAIVVSCIAGPPGDFGPYAAIVCVGTSGAGGRGGAGMFVEHEFHCDTDGSGDRGIGIEADLFVTGTKASTGRHTAVLASGNLALDDATQKVAIVVGFSASVNQNAGKAGQLIGIDCHVTAAVTANVDNAIGVNVRDMGTSAVLATAINVAPQTGAGSFAISTLGGRVRFDGTIVPATANAAGKKGEIATDANFIYVCVADNTWKRVGIATW